MGISAFTGNSAGASSLAQPQPSIGKGIIPASAVLEQAETVAGALHDLFLLSCSLFHLQWDFGAPSHTGVHKLGEKQPEGSSPSLVNWRGCVGKAETE